MSHYREASAVTLGSKGSSLSSSSVYAVARGGAQVRIDSPVLSSTPSLEKHRTTITIPEFLTLEETRAFLVVLLNHLLLRNSFPSGLSLQCISEALNSKPLGFRFVELEVVTEHELSVLNSTYCALLGVSAILDHQSGALSSLADVAAALSCEALKADVTAFNLTDSGDGHTSKEEVGVARDMRVLLRGSKLVGKDKIPSVASIPEVHGTVRGQVKLMHSKLRVELNSGHKLGVSVCTVVWPLAASLCELGTCSFARAQSNLFSIGSNDLNSSLREIFQRECPTDASLSRALDAAFKLLYVGHYYDKFAHQISVLFALVWKIVAWEVVTAFAVLDAAGLNDAQENGDSSKVEKKNKKVVFEAAEVNDAQENRESSKVEKKNKKNKKKIVFEAAELNYAKVEKKNKKKVVLGEGTGFILPLIRDGLQSEIHGAVKNSLLLETWVADFLSFLDLTEPKFNEFLLKVKDVLESNEPSRRLPKIPKGTRDFSKEQMTIRKKIFSIIEEAFERHGSTALDTPAFELRETLMGKYGEDSKLIFDLADQGGELCSLRYDLTVPFARFVAMNSLTSYKRHQIGKVYRRDNPSKGRHREFYQCDFDIAGTPVKMGPDFEVVRILTEVLDELDIGDYEIKLNHRKLLDGMMQICGVPPERFRTICSSIDKLDKQSFEQIRKEMVEEKGLATETADRIESFVKEKGPPLALLSKFKQEGSAFLENAGSFDALNDLEILFKALDKSKCIDKVVFDLSLARGLDYYTGIIFEAVFKGGTQVGSIAAGGRYDNLIGMFGSKEVPAVGLSLGIERIFAIMEEHQKDPKQMARPTKTQVLVSILENNLTLGAELAGELWDARMHVELLCSKRRQTHFDYAKESKIPWMVLVGARELNEGTVQLKNLQASNDVSINIPREKLVDELGRRLCPWGPKLAASNFMRPCRFLPK